MSFNAPLSAETKVISIFYVSRCNQYSVTLVFRSGFVSKSRKGLNMRHSTLQIIKEITIEEPLTGIVREKIERDPICAGPHSTRERDIEYPVGTAIKSVKRARRAEVLVGK